MAESLVAVTQGSGKNLHTFNRTIGTNSVEDEVILNGEQYLATYTVSSQGTSIATANDHVLQIMAGASLNVYIRRIRVYQLAPATTAALTAMQLIRLTTAGTGGTARTPQAHDSTDAASGATAMTLPTVKGTEAAVDIDRVTFIPVQTVGAGTTGTQNSLLVDWDFDRLRIKSIRIPSGTTNGLAVKILTATAACTVYVQATFVEANF